MYSYENGNLPSLSSLVVRFIRIFLLLVSLSLYIHCVCVCIYMCNLLKWFSMNFFSSASSFFYYFFVLSQFFGGIFASASVLFDFRWSCWFRLCSYTTQNEYRWCMRSWRGFEEKFIMVIDKRLCDHVRFFDIIWSFFEVFSSTHFEFDAP